MNNETALVITLVLLITLLVVVVIVLYRKYRQGEDSSSDSTDSQVEKKNKKNRKTLKAMYTPQSVGVRTGNKRLFKTNKGLRVYDTNEKGWPMPETQINNTT